MLRPIGSGLPLGFFSFAIGMLLLGCQAIGWIPISEPKDVGMLESFEGLDEEPDQIRVGHRRSARSHARGPLPREVRGGWHGCPRP